MPTPSTLTPQHADASNLSLRTQAMLAFGLALAITLLLEHSSFDVVISQWFYQGNGEWLIDKQARLADLLFYTGIKRLLIGLEVYVIAAWLYRRYQSHKNMPNTPTPGWFYPLQRFSTNELGYLWVVMLLIPTIVASLKAITHVPCPNHLQIFSGDYAYVSLWQDIVSSSHEKCFPAAHASSGFALYAWAFLPSLQSYRGRIVSFVTGLAWVMGLYKMAIGDHFFSHTAVSMCLAWALCSLLADYMLRPAVAKK